MPIARYVQLFEFFRAAGSDYVEQLCWAVLRPDRPLTAPGLLERLGADPAAVTKARPLDMAPEDGVVFAEQRGDVLVLVSSFPGSPERYETWRIVDDATVCQVFWVVNNYNELSYAAGGVLVTALDTLRPDVTWGAEPDALDAHLGALRDLHRPGMPPGPDWETAMATLESLTETGLDAAWFESPQWTAVVPGR